MQDDSGTGAPAIGRECSGPEQGDNSDVATCPECKCDVRTGVAVSTSVNVPVRAGVSVSSRKRREVATFCTYECMLAFARRAVGVKS